MILDTVNTDYGVVKNFKFTLLFKNLLFHDKSR
jgi:hypothetical protein